MSDYHILQGTNRDGNTDHTGSNERIQSAAEHDVICLVVGNNDVQWYPFTVYGTWADIN